MDEDTVAAEDYIIETPAPTQQIVEVPPGKFHLLITQDTYVAGWMVMRLTPSYQFVTRFNFRAGDGSFYLWPIPKVLNTTYVINLVVELDFPEILHRELMRLLRDQLAITTAPVLFRVGVVRDSSIYSWQYLISELDAALGGRQLDGLHVPRGEVTTEW